MLYFVMYFVTASHHKYVKINKKRNEKKLHSRRMAMGAVLIRPSQYFVNIFRSYLIWLNSQVIIGYILTCTNTHIDRQSHDD